MAPLAPHHRQQLIDSAISDAMIKTRRYWTATTKQELAALGFADYQQRIPALVVPLHRGDGRPAWAQIRPDSPRIETRKNGKERVVKYEMPAGSHMLIDVHPALLAAINDPKIPAWIVEGIKKADALASRGHLALGLLGVWNWIGGNENGGKKALPDWRDIALNDRIVYIAFDSDMATNPNVALAAAELQQYLKSKSATVKIIHLPPAANGDKQGIDDFLAAGGTMQELIDTADDSPPTIPTNSATILPGAKRELPEMPLSDIVNAEDLVKQHGQDLRYCYDWNKWFAWNGTHWRIDNTGEVMRRCRATIKDIIRRATYVDDVGVFQSMMAHAKNSLATSKLVAMAKAAQMDLPILPDEMDTHHFFLNCINGTIDLTTGQLKPHDRQDYLTNCLAINYDPQAQCPTWRRFLDEIMGGNQTLIDFLQRGIGYSLSGDVREQVMFVLWGKGRNGKSSFVNLVLALLGSYAMKAPSDLLMVSRNQDRHPTEKADLFRRRFVAAIETEEGRQLSEVFVKEATGGDPIRARRMREDFWQFWPTHKLWLATNHKPVIRGTDDAIWRRICLVPFVQKFEGETADKTLPEKLRAELPGILRWAVEGCLMWQRDGLGLPDEVKNAVKEYRDEMDILGSFIEECCEVGNGKLANASQLYKAYKAWAEAGGEFYITQTQFGRKMRERGFEKDKQGTILYRGIGILDSSTKTVQMEERNENQQDTEKDEKYLGQFGPNSSINSTPPHEGGLYRKTIQTIQTVQNCPKTDNLSCPKCGASNTVLVGLNWQCKSCPHVWRTQKIKESP